MRAKGDEIVPKWIDYFVLHREIKPITITRRFKQFAITDGVLPWNDFDLVFPMADLYAGVIR